MILKYIECKKKCENFQSRVEAEVSRLDVLVRNTVGYFVHVTAVFVTML